MTPRTTTTGHCPICNRHDVIEVNGRAIAHNRTGGDILCRGTGKPLGEPEWLTIAEVADRLRVSRMTAYRLVHGGLLRAHQFGQSMRVLRSDLDAYIASAEVAWR